MKIKEENHKIKIELNDFKKRNELLEINVQLLQNNSINEHQKLHSAQSGSLIESDVRLYSNIEQIR